MEILCRFSEFQNITRGGHDGVVYIYKFMCTPLEKVGQPDQESSTEELEITVDCCDGRLSTWNIKDRDMNEKVLYWYAREAINKNPNETEQKIMLHMRNTPKQCPYDPDRIRFPNPEPFVVEYSRKIGF